MLNQASYSKKETAIVFDNIRSVHNVGSIFRTADAAGVSKIYLCGITPTPLDRFGRPRRDLAKVALGAERIVSWERRQNIPALLSELRRQNFFIVAVEQSPNSVDYKKIKLPPKTKAAFVFGGEVSGISSAHLKLCDVVAEIPMRGRKESLNVAVAAGIILYQFLP